MKTLACVLVGQASGALVGEDLIAETPRDILANLTSSSSSDFANLALSLAMTSNITGLHALLAERLLHNSDPTSTEDEELAAGLAPVLEVVNDTLEPTVMQGKDLAQQTISEFEALFLHCEELAAEAFNQSILDQEALVDRSSNHSFCRHQESALTTAWTNCQSMADAAEKIRAYKCQLYSESNHIPSSSCFPIGGENAEDFHARKLELFEKNLADLLQFKDACNLSTESAASVSERCNKQRTSMLQKKSYCDTEQHLLDSSICMLNNKMVSDCAQSKTCQQQTLASYEIANESAKISEEKIKEMWEQLQEIRCMIDAVQQRQADGALDHCSTSTYSVAHLTLKYSALPPFSPCEEMNETMGSPEYMQTLYGSLPANVQVQACRSQCCNEAANRRNTSV